MIFYEINCSKMDFSKICLIMFEIIKQRHILGVVIGFIIMFFTIIFQKKSYSLVTQTQMS